MAANDLSGVSDEELLKAAMSPAKTTSGSSRLSSVSEEDLLKFAGQPKAPQTWGETAVDVGKSLAAGALRGTAFLADLPSDLAQLAVIGGEKLTGYEAPQSLKSAIDTNFREGMSDLTGGFSDRKAETRLGKYAGTIGEFVPGAVAAGLTGGASMAANIARGAVAPAIASEAAGEIADATGFNPTVARVAGALAGGWGASKAEAALRNVISPRGVNPQDLAYASILKDHGVDVMAGQATKNARLMGIESRTPRGQAILENQLQQVTKAAMRTIGSDADLAIPDTLLAAKDGIVGRLNGIADSIDVVPQVGASSGLAKTAADYFHGGVMPSVPKRISDMVNDIESAASSGTSIPGQQLRIWRTELGDLASSTDNVAMKNTFRSAVDMIDDMQEGALRAAGRLNDYNSLREARGMYRNYLAIRDASLKSDSGILNPAHIRSALISQGKAALATGQRGSLGDLAMAAQNLLKSGAAQHRSAIGKFVSTLIDGMGGSSGAWIGSTLGGTPGAIVGALIGAGVPLSYQVSTGMARRLLASPIMQKALMAGASSGISSSVPRIMPSVSGLQGAVMNHANGGRVVRKSGGRVSSHEADADRLVRAAERAKKGWSAQTEPLLNHSDEHIVHALDVANRSI